MSRLNTSNTSLKMHEVESIIIESTLNRSKKNKLIAEIKEHQQKKLTLANTLKALAPGI